MEYGELAGLLTDIGRYKHCDEQGNWTLLSSEQAQQVKRSAFMRGTLEMCAQTLSVTWPETDGTTQRVDPVIAPVFVDSTGASSEYACVNNSVIGWGLDSILKLTAFVQFVVLAWGSDFASSNVRTKCFIMSKFTEYLSEGHHHGRVSLLDLFCISHIITRMVVKTLTCESLIPKCCAVSFVMRFTPRLNRYLKALREIIERDLLNGGFVAGGIVDEECTSHTARIISMTLLRSLRSKGRDNEKQGRHEPLLRELYDKLVSLLNGDVRLLKFCHICNSCCKNAREAAVKIEDAMVTAYAELLGADRPSTSRWYTFEPTLVHQGGVALIHDLGREFGHSALGVVEEVVDLDEGGINDRPGQDAQDVGFQAYVAKKLRRACDAHLDPEHKMDIVQALWAVEPLGKLNANLQYRDNAGDAFLDACYQKGVVYETESDIFLRATSSAESAYPLSFLVHHFVADAMVDEEEFALSAFQRIVCLASQLYARVVLVLRDFPWKVLCLADGRYTTEEIDKFIEEFKKSPACDLDPGFARILLEMCPTKEALLGVAKQMLEAIFKRLKATNMCLERFLYLVKSSAPYTKRKPRAARLIVGGTLTQLRLRHASRGYSQHRGQLKRADLLKLGVRLRVAKPRKRNGQPRWHFRYANHSVNRSFEQNPDMGYVEKKAVRSRACKEWTSLVVVAQASFKAGWNVTQDAVDNADAGNDPSE